MFALLALIGNLHLRANWPRTQAMWDKRNVPRPRGRKETYPGCVGGEKCTQAAWEERNIPHAGHVREEKCTQVAWEERNVSLLPHGLGTRLILGITLQ